MANRYGPGRSNTAARPASATHWTSPNRPVRANAQHVHVVAHIPTTGCTSDVHTANPRSSAVRTSPEKNANAASMAVTCGSSSSDSTRALTSASASRAGSTRLQLKKRFAARRQPHRTISHSSAPSGSTSLSTASTSSPRPCQPSASASTIAAVTPAPRSNANRASSSPQAMSDMVTALAAASTITSRSADRSLRVINCASCIRMRASDNPDRSSCVRICF